MAQFSLLNALVVLAMLLLVTWLGHRLSGTSTNQREFFTAGGGLPWWAVSASLYATVLSAVSFISIPATVFRDGGNLTFVQIIFGLMLGKVVLTLLFVRPYYESRGVDTVYDYLAIRISPKVATACMILSVTLLIAQNSIVVLSAALVLNIITDLSVAACCVTIVGFSVLWSWIGGLRTVVWTDAVLFGVFLSGALTSAMLTLSSSDLGLVEAFHYLDAAAKTTLIDVSTDPSKSYTLWTGLVTGTLLGMAVIGSQSSLQRIRSCRSVTDAKKAFIFSSLLYITPCMLLLVGLGLSLFYGINGVPDGLAARLADQPDQVFPYFIVHEIPNGVSGLFIAAIFAAAISSLDSRLTELSDVTVTNIYKRYFRTSASEGHYLRAARWFLIAWGGVYCATSVALSKIDGRNLLDLTWQVQNTLAGPILGAFVMARFGLGSTLTTAIGTLIAIAGALYLRHEGISHFWWFPSSLLIMFAIGWLGSRRRPDASGVIT